MFFEFDNIVEFKYFRFVEKSKSKQFNYISIAKLGNECYSQTVGMTLSDDGKHQVSIGEGCAHTGVVIHELMHAIGIQMST